MYENNAARAQSRTRAFHNELTILHKISKYRKYSMTTSIFVRKWNNLNKMDNCRKAQSNVEIRERGKFDLWECFENEPLIKTFPE